MQQRPEQYNPDEILRDRIFHLREAFEFGVGIIGQTVESAEAAPQKLHELGTLVHQFAHLKEEHQEVQDTVNETLAATDNLIDLTDRAKGAAQTVSFEELLIQAQDQRPAA